MLTCVNVAVNVKTLIAVTELSCVTLTESSSQELTKNSKFTSPSLLRFLFRKKVSRYLE